MDTGLYDVETAFSIKLGLNKADRLRTGESAMTHGKREHSPIFMPHWSILNGCFASSHDHHRSAS
jgi:Peptidase C1-like family